jgi:protein involved in polysaccharide export with SLBB domain
MAVLFGRWILALAFLSCGAAGAQNQRPVSVSSSELGKDNLSLAAASSAQIKVVLLQNPGLMVELKRWVAREATDHGQIIGESDLTDDAIFDRLETDVRFRSTATLLLQRFGYLVPKMNPDSPAGKEQELLVQERVKWLAQDQEEELNAARQRAALGSESQTPQETTPLRNGPVGPNQQSLPQGNRGLLERTQLTQGDEQVPTDFSLLGLNDGADRFLDNLEANRFGPLGRDDGSDRLLDNFEANPFGSLMPQPGATATGGQSASLVATAGSENPNSIQNTLIGAVPGSGTNGAGQFPNVSSRGAVSEPFTPEFAARERIPNRQYQNQVVLQSAEVTRARNPFSDVPSLYDIYQQANPHPSTPTRFGKDVFDNGTRDAQSIPMDLPAGPDYVVGPGDGLAINLWGGVSQRLFRTVDREGRVSLPELGPVLVSGKSLSDVQQNLQQVLRGQFRGEFADVSLARLRTIRVYVVGDVVNPGAYDISSLSTPLNALLAAGGPTPRGSFRIVKHYRGNELTQVVDLYDLLLHGVKSDIERLDNGDTVLVPPIGPQVTVEGMVRRPAIYELKDEKDLNSALDLAGGLLPSAALQHIEVQRIVAHEQQTMMSLDIPEGTDPSEASKKLASFEIHDGDQIRLFPIAPYNENAVYLEGHVVRPGRYSYHADMRVTDVISSYKDLLPEPATQYVEIIRLNPPDFHPSVQGFDLAEAISDPSHAPLIKPMDTVRVFSRYDFENPPSVSVWGDVRAPGTYQTSGQIHLSDAVHLAGGLAPDAKTEDAQVFRYLPDGESTIFSVSLSGALAGNSTENILLQSRDRLLIHKNADSLQPSTVYVQGDVAKPGRYPLTTNMTVADLIRVGGGLKPSADKQIADLIHYNYQDGEQSKLTGQRESISISAALSGDANSNVPMHNGDVLTIRELPGWNDLGASISIKGEVMHPGTYGIRPGERLSSILARAGGFQPDAYPYGAVLQRIQVRELEAQAQDQMILRVKDAQAGLELLPDTDPKAKQAKETARQQYQATLTELSSNPPAGRVSIRIAGKTDRWRNTSADIEVRAGDTLTIPKRPGQVMVTGQVFNPTAVSFRPGRSAKWYLSQSGGPTALANKKAIFVVRADGSVVAEKQGLWSGDALSATLQPGDTVVVPERAIGGGRDWTTLFTAAQVASSIASTAFIAARY